MAYILLKNGMDTILCIDDDIDFLKLLEAILPKRINTSEKKPHYSFEFLSDPLEAIARIKAFSSEKNNLAMIITDQNMPEIKGLDLLIKTKEISFKAKKIILTADTELNIALQAINNNIADKYMVKPIRDREDFAIIVKSLLNVFHMEKTVTSQQALLYQTARMASIGTLAAGVAHEINNPLNSVIGAVQIIKRDMGDLISLLELYSQTTSLSSEDAEKIKKHKNEIDLLYILEHREEKPAICETAVKRIQTIVENLRTFTHLDKSNVTMVDINQELDNSWDSIPTDRRGTSKIVRIFGQIAKLPCNGRQMNQVFMEILLNSLHSMEGDEEGLITIKTTLINEKAIKILISDCGYGIPEEKIKHIFDPFFTTKEIGTGPGLGLFLCYSIIQKHNGMIKAFNNPDKGVTVTIELPVDQKKDNLDYTPLDIKEK